jgi:hypothetical protein
MAQYIGREILDVLRVHLGSVAFEQRPHLRQPAPADDRSGRCAEVDALFNQL